MSRLPFVLAGFILAGGAAAADVTPREAWDGWLAALDEADAEVTTGSVDDTGTGLVVTDLSIATAQGADGYSVKIDDLALAQNGDGTVGVTLSPEYRVVLSGTDEDGADREVHLLVQHPGLAMTVADEAGARQHAFAAPEIRVTLEQILTDGEPVETEGVVVFEDASGHYDAKGGPSAFSAARVSLDASGSEPDTGERYEATVGMRGFESANLLRILGRDTAELARQLEPGASLDGTFGTDATTFELNALVDGESSAISGTVGPADTRLSLSARGLDYATESRDLDLAFSGSALPLPQVTVSAGSSALALAVPILAADEPQPFALDLSLLEVALDDGLWNMLDPAGILARDPGEILLDIAGEIAVEQDIDARDMAEGASDELRSLDINTVRIAFAEAEVEAGGDLEVARSPTGTPQLVGEIGVTLTGATELLDKLVQAGIVPEQQAMGTRMMLGMFAKPGATEGELVSRIRLAEDGRVFVNDQQVR